MTNPNNAIGTNAAYGGRTSVNAANDDLATYTGAGVLSGFALSPDTGMVLNLGGVSGTRDVAVAEDAGGNRTTINNISGAPISVTIPAAPASQSRIDAVVAYVANPPQGSSTVVDNPAACGLIVVSGTASSSPSVPNDSAIRTAITADGASGSTAYYAILGTVTVASGTTNITSNMISAGTQVSPTLADGSVTSDKVDFTTFQTLIDNGTASPATTQNVNLPVDIANYRYILAQATYAQYDETYGTVLIPVADLGKRFSVSGQNLHSGGYPSDEWTITITTTSNKLTFSNCSLNRVPTSDGGNVVGYRNQNIRLGKIWALK